MVTQGWFIQRQIVVKRIRLLCCLSRLQEQSRQEEWCAWYMLKMWHGAEASEMLRSEESQIGTHTSWRWICHCECFQQALGRDCRERGNHRTQSACRKAVFLYICKQIILSTVCTETMQAGRTKTIEMKNAQPWTHLFELLCYCSWVWEHASCYFPPIYHHLSLTCSSIWTTMLLTSAHMRSEGYCTWFVCLCVCVCVCLHLFLPYRDRAGSSAIPTALAQQGLEKLCGDFA